MKNTDKYLGVQFLLCSVLETYCQEAFDFAIKNDKVTANLIRKEVLYISKSVKYLRDKLKPVIKTEEHNLQFYKEFEILKEKLDKHFDL